MADRVMKVGVFKNLFCKEAVFHGNYAWPGTLPLPSTLTLKPAEEGLMEAPVRNVSTMGIQGKVW